MIHPYVARFIALLVLLMNPWSAQHSGDIIATTLMIPDEAVRLRILANSDSPHDQWLKHRVRDEVFHYVQASVGELETVDASRQWIADELPNITRLVEQTVTEHGFSYDVTVDYGAVPFPTKIYGNHVYPAGEYEAIRITIGDGNGANWWCVLFPPLCFIDMSNAAAVTGEEAVATDEKGNDEDSEAEDEDIDAEAKTTDMETSEAEHNDEMLEVRFFIIDWVNRLIDKIKHAV